MTESDDLFLDDPLLQALLGPATPGELAGEGAALEAFRASRQSGNRRRHLRLITGGGGVVVALALSSGVAAAYTGHLPRPLQIVAHRYIPFPGLLSVPAPAPHVAPPRADRIALAHPRTSSRPHTGNRPSPSAAPAVHATPQVVPAAKPSPTSAPVAASPTAAPTSQPTPTPSASPTPPPVFTATSSASSVHIHNGVTLMGTLTKNDKPLAGRTVYAVETVAGTKESKRVAQGTTAQDGTIALDVPALTRNVTLKLVTGAKVASNALRVIVQPKVTTKLKANGQTYGVTATADGGVEGDTAVLQRWDDGSWTNVVTKKLTSDLTVHFSVPVPANDRRYRVRVAATSLHGVGFGPFTAKTAQPPS